MSTDTLPVYNNKASSITDLQSSGREIDPERDEVSVNRGNERYDTSGRCKCHCRCNSSASVERPSKQDSPDTDNTPIEVVAEPRLPSRIGRQIYDTNKGITVFVDETSNEYLVDKDEDLARRFVLTVRSDYDGFFSAASDARIATIYSPVARRIFLEVVPDHPKVKYKQNFIAMVYPYEPMFYYFDEMKNRASTLEPLDSENLDDFEVLERWYNKDLKPEYDTIRGKIEQGNVRFDQLWAIFRPTCLLFSFDDFSQPQLTVLISARTDSVYRHHTNSEKEAFSIAVWWVVWDRDMQAYTRNCRSHHVEAFKGVRPITSLSVYPLDFHNKDIFVLGKKKNLLSYLQARGEEYRRLTSVTAVCMYHKGTTEEIGQSKRKSFVEGRVIVDQDEAEVSEEGRRYHEDLVSRTQPNPMKNTSMDDRYASWDHHPGDVPFSALQAQLCPSSVSAFSLETLEWYTVLIDNLTSIKWNPAALDHLVLEEQSKKMLKGLVELHKRNQTNVISDVIEGKGLGLVVALHGPPGVGKTLTAESVAEFTQKPLYQVNVGDITHRIDQTFKRASRWDAVVLIDEADVILEKRSLEDFKRNTYVSIFLRALEYYRGILFITSNRLRTIDTASQSRIHIAIKFPPLTSFVRRQIWSRFIDRLDESEARAKRELREKLDDLQEWNLNGRQIRNVIMIAQSLRLSEERRRGALRYIDVEEVANKTSEFQDFFEEEGEGKRGALREVPGRRFREH